VGKPKSGLLFGLGEFMFYGDWLYRKEQLTPDKVIIGATNIKWGFGGEKR